MKQQPILKECTREDTDPLGVYKVTAPLPMCIAPSPPPPLPSDTHAHTLLMGGPNLSAGSESVGAALWNMAFEDNWRLQHCKHKALWLRNKHGGALGWEVGCYLAAQGTA